jgi:NADH-quinone oxidoreductase subunit E
MKELAEPVQKKIDWVVSRYPIRQAAMLPILYIMQEVYGSISDDAILHASKILQVPPATVYGVFSFYTMFRRPWEGKHTVWVCSTLSCALAGSEKLFDHCRAKLGCKKDGTTPDRMFTVKKQECLGACDKAVVVQIDDDYYFNQTPESLQAVLQKVRGPA